MKAAALLVFLVVLTAFVSETDARRRWWRRTVRRVGRFIGKVAKGAVKAYKIYKQWKENGKRGVELTQDEFLENLATRDISELVDVSRIPDAELDELLSVQRQTRDAMDELESGDVQEP